MHLYLFIINVKLTHHYKKYVHNSWHKRYLINPFLDKCITIMQQTSLKSSDQKHGNSLYIEVLLLERVENIVAKGEIALLSECFLKSSAAEASESVYMK